MIMNSNAPVSEATTGDPSQIEKPQQNGSTQQEKPSVVQNEGSGLKEVDCAVSTSQKADEKTGNDSVDKDECSALTSEDVSEGLSDTRAQTFPQRLMEMLSNEENSDSIRWLPHGKSFIIYRKKRFAEEVLPKYFKACKYTSFTRKLNRWGFQRVTRGPEMGSYHHPKFLKDDPMQCLQMCSSTGTSPAKFAPQFFPGAAGPNVQGMMPLLPGSMPFMSFYPGMMPFGIAMPSQMTAGTDAANTMMMQQQQQMAMLQMHQFQQYQMQQFQQALQQQQQLQPQQPQSNACAISSNSVSATAPVSNNANNGSVINQVSSGNNHCSSNNGETITSNVSSNEKVNSTAGMGVDALMIQQQMQLQQQRSSYSEQQQPQTDRSQEDINPQSQHPQQNQQVSHSQSQQTQLQQQPQLQQQLQSFQQQQQPQMLQQQQQPQILHHQQVTQMQQHQLQHQHPGQFGAMSTPENSGEPMDSDQQPRQQQQIPPQQGTQQLDSRLF